MSKIVGIDFGTTNSLAAYTFNGKPRTIKGGEIEHVLPSVICKYEGKLFVGKDAKENIAAFENGDGVAEIKRLIGSGETINFDGKQMEPYEISAIILKKIKRNLKLFFNEDVEEAVITVPAEFSDAQRNEIIRAGELAGFKVKKIINEPTAALLAYANQNEVKDETLICYDFGGGTFDVSIAKITGSGYYGKDISVIGVGGDRKLGGGDIDREVMSFLEKDIRRIKGKGLSRYGKIQLLLAVEKLKMELSSREQAAISLTDILLEDGQRTGYFKQITRYEFENLIEKFIDRTIDIVRQTLKENDISSRDIYSVLLVGGSSKIPMVSEKLKSALGLSSTLGNLNPNECVAIGASIEAANISGQAGLRDRVSIRRDVCPFTLGLKYEDNGMKDLYDPLITKNFPYGAEYSEEYVTVLNYQNSMKLEIYQGEKNRASLNDYVCTFNVTGIPERPAGLEKVRVYFKYDADGILEVRAKILSTGKELKHSQNYGYSLGVSRNSKVKVEDHFISEEKIDDAIVLIDSINKYGDKADTKKIYDAIKFEDEDSLNDITKDLLD